MLADSLEKYKKKKKRQQQHHTLLTTFHSSLDSTENDHAASTRKTAATVNIEHTNTHTIYRAREGPSRSEPKHELEQSEPHFISQN